MKNATEVVTELYRKFPKVEFIDERDLGEDIVGLMFEYRNTEVDEEQLKAYLDSIGNWYRIRESREFYGGKSLLVKAEDDYITLPVEDDLSVDWYYKHRDDYDPYGEPKPDYLLGESIAKDESGTWVMLRKGELPDGTETMLFIHYPKVEGKGACIINGKEGVNDPTNTEPLYVEGSTANIGGWEETLDWDYIVHLFLHQDGVKFDYDDEEEIDPDDDPTEGRFKYIASKSVLDSDGFYTDYTWYFDKEEGKHVFVFGDNDIYFPEDGDYDWEVEGDDERAKEEAQEWFDSYDGFEEDDRYDESLKEEETQIDKSDKEEVKRIVKKLQDEFPDLHIYQKNGKNKVWVIADNESGNLYKVCYSASKLKSELKDLEWKIKSDINFSRRLNKKNESLKESFGRPSPWHNEPDEPYVIVLNDEHKSEIDCYSIKDAIDTANRENVDIIELRPDPYSSKVIKRYSRNASGTFETLLKEVAISLAKSRLTGADIADNLMANYKADKDTACELGKDAYNYVRYELGYFDESLKESSDDDLLNTCKEKYRSLIDIADSASDFSSIKEAITKMFDEVGGKVMFEESSRRYVSFSGDVKGHTLWNSVSLDYQQGDLHRLAEDLTMAFYRTNGGKGYNTYTLIDKIKGTNESLKENLFNELSRDFEEARKEWAEYGLDISFDDALKIWQEKSPLAEPDTFYSKPLYNPEAWKDLVKMFTGKEPELDYVEYKGHHIEDYYHNGEYIIDGGLDCFDSIEDAKRFIDGELGESLKEDYCDMFGCESGYFTRDDLNELMYEINDRCPKGMQATAIYMSNDGKTLEVDMEDDEYGSETVYKKIDMRKIRKPSDLLRYANSIIADF